MFFGLSETRTTISDLLTPEVLTLHFFLHGFCFVSKPTYHIRANLGTRSKHQLTLSVGIVDLTGEEGGQLIRPAYRLIKEALPIASANNSNNVGTVNELAQNCNKCVHAQTNAHMHICEQKANFDVRNISRIIQDFDTKKYQHVSSPFIRAK